MSLKNAAKWLSIAGATYLAGTAISNELFGTNFKTIGNWSSGTWTGGAQNTDANLGSALAATTSSASGATAAPGSGGGVMDTLGKVGSGILDFAKSSGGGTLIAGALQGLAAGKAAEQQIDEQRRYKRAFTPEEMQQINGGVGTAAAPGSTIGGFSTGGYLDRARRVSEFLGERRQPAVGAPTATPDQVASYARGG